MPKIPKIKLAAEYLLKLAETAEMEMSPADEQAHEQLETPEEELLEHQDTASEDPNLEQHPLEEEALAPAEEPEHEQLEAPEAEAIEHPEEQVHDDLAVEQLLSQLTPEQIEQLATELSEDIQTPGEEDSGNTAALAQAIQEHLTQNPDATVPEASPEKLAALEIFKTAEYIEGFLSQATSEGVTIKKAVDLYDRVLINVLELVKDAEAKKKHEESETPEEEKLEHEKGEEPLDEVKKAAYYQGFIDSAHEYGLTLDQALDFAKQAGLRDAAKNLGRFLKETKPVRAVKDVVEKAKNTITVPAEKAKDLFKELGTSKNKPKRSVFEPKTTGKGIHYDESGGKAFLKKQSSLVENYVGLSPEDSAALKLADLIKDAGVRSRLINKAVSSGSKAKGAFTRTKVPRSGKAPSAYEAASARYPKDIPPPTAAPKVTPNPAASAAQASEAPKGAGKAKASTFSSIEEELMYEEARRRPSHHRSPAEQELINRVEREAAERVHASNRSRATPPPNAESKKQKDLRQKAVEMADPSQATSFENTLNHSLDTPIGPLPPGLKHRLAAQLGAAGRFASENPLSAALVTGVGGAGLYAGLQDHPENPQQYPYYR
jgi:hypothetical protein